MTRGQINSLIQKYVFENDVAKLTDIIHMYPELEDSIAPSIKKMLTRVENINTALRRDGLEAMQIKIEGFTK